MYCNRYVIDKELIGFDLRFRFKLNPSLVCYTHISFPHCFDSGKIPQKNNNNCRFYSGNLTKKVA